MRATLLRSLVPGCGLALAGLGLALALQPVRFGATARLLTEAILAVDAETGDYDPHFFQNQLELVKSPTVLTDAVQRLQAQPIDSMELRTVLALNPAEAARFLGNCITLRPVRGTWLLEIGAVVREPHEAAAVANAVAEAYRDQSAVLWNAKRPRLKETWEERLAQYPELQAAHRRVAALLKDLKVSAHEYHEVELRNQMGWDHLCCFGKRAPAQTIRLAPERDVHGGRRLAARAANGVLLSRYRQPGGPACNSTGTTGSDVPAPPWHGAEGR